MPSTWARGARASWGAAVMRRVSEEVLEDSIAASRMSGLTPAFSSASLNSLVFSLLVSDRLT